MGGLLALHLAARHPDRFTSVVALNGTYASVVDIVNSPVRMLWRAPRTWVIYQMRWSVHAIWRSPRLRCPGRAFG
jgi:pimeloyl-ACP methyl ester carboxylesterase